MPEYYERYGLRSNPFVLRFLDPLLSVEDDACLLRDIDGFSRMNLVEDYLRNRVGLPNAQLDRPAFVLITGNDKSGLTSAANEVLARYRRIRNLGSRFLTIKETATDHSALDLFNRWTAALAARLNRLQPRLQVAPEVSAALIRARGLSNLSTLDYDLQSVIADLLPALQVQPVAAFGTCLEKIKTSKVIEIAQVVFESFPTICVFTVPLGAFDVDDVANRNPDIHVLRLGHLNSEEVRKVLEKKWGQPSLPFHAPTMGDFCEDRKHTIGVVLTVAEKLLRKKVQYYEKLNLGDTWPHDKELELTALNTLELLEVVVNGGN